MIFQRTRWLFGTHTEIYCLRDVETAKVEQHPVSNRQCTRVVIILRNEKKIPFSYTYESSDIGNKEQLMEEIVAFLKD